MAPECRCCNLNTGQHDHELCEHPCCPCWDLEDEDL